MRTSDKTGDEALQDVIDDPSGDAKGWFIIIRDGPLRHDSDYRLSKPTGDVYVLWRKTRELAIEQLKLHQTQVHQGYGAPLKELHPIAFDHECNFGHYENGSFLLLNAAQDGSEQQILDLEKKLREAEKVLPLPDSLKNLGNTLTDEYDCPGCGATVESAEVIIGGGAKHTWCTLDCFRKNPPRGWVTHTVKDLILERDGAEKAEELLEEKIEELKRTLATTERHATALRIDLEDALANHEAEVDDMREDYEDAHESFEEARSALCVEISKLKVRKVELETLLENDWVQPMKPIGKYCGQPCSSSTGICGSLTYGWGELSMNGYWEYPCDLCANQEYPMATTTLDNSQIVSSDNLPDDVDQLITKTANRAVKKAVKQIKDKSACGVCNKVLANPKGVQEHQRATKCGIVLNNMIATKQLTAEPASVGHKTEAVYLAEIDYKLQVALKSMKGQVIQTCVRWISTAAAIATIAYHVV